MEKYVMLRGRVYDKWYDLDNKAHYHITVKPIDKDKLYDASINVGTILLSKNNQNKIKYKSSKLKIYYSENYKHEILNKMLEQKKHLTYCNDEFYLDYINMNLFQKHKVKMIDSIHHKEEYLFDIIERNIQKAINNDDIEVFIFGFLYTSKKGIHDIHMNQGSEDYYKCKDRPFSDGGLFFYNKKENKWTVLFILFLSQSLDSKK